MQVTLDIQTPAENVIGPKNTWSGGIWMSNRVNINHTWIIRDFDTKKSFPTWQLSEEII